MAAEVPKRQCEHVRCEEEPVAKVSGGVETRRINLSGFGQVFAVGWSGEYCAKHVQSVVRTQLFQTRHDMPIVIQGLS